MDRLHSLSKKKLLGFLVVLFLVAAVPLTVFIARQQQDIRQRASGTEATLFWGENSCHQPITSTLQAAPGEQKVLVLCMNTSVPVNSFQLKLALNNALSVGSINSILEGAAAQQLRQAFAKSFGEVGPQTFFFSKGDNERQLLGANLELAKATVTAGSQTSSGTISFTHNDVVLSSPNRATGISVSLPTLSYTIAKITPPRSEPEGTLFWAKNSCNQRITNILQLTTGEKTTLLLCMNTAIPVNAFQMRIPFSNALSPGSINNISEGTAAQQLRQEFVKSFGVVEPDTFFFAKGDITEAIQGTNLELVKATVTAANQVRSGTLTLTQSDVLFTTAGKPDSLRISLPTLSYTIVDPTTPTVTYTVIPQNPRANQEFFVTIANRSNPEIQYIAMLVNGQPEWIGQNTHGTGWGTSGKPAGTYTFQLIGNCDAQKYQQGQLDCRNGTRFNQITIVVSEAEQQACSVIMNLSKINPVAGERITATITLDRSNLPYNGWDRNTLYEFTGNIGRTPGLQPVGTISNNYGGRPANGQYTFAAVAGQHTLQFAVEAYDAAGNQKQQAFFCSGIATYHATTAPTNIPTRIPTATSVPGSTLLHLSVDFPNLLRRPQTSIAPQEERITVELYDTSNRKVHEAAGNLTPVNTPVSEIPLIARTYAGTINLGQGFPTGAYTVKIKNQKYLAKELPGTVTITAQQTTMAPATTLVAGDIDNNNEIDLADFNVWLACFGKTMEDTVSGVSCANSDLNEDGHVDSGAVKFDYLVLLDAFRSIKGD